MEDIAPNIMSPDEAQVWKARLTQTVHDLRVLLWEGFHREAWAALRYPTWTACVQGIAHELDLSERHLWRLHSANLSEQALTHGTVGQLPERQLRPLRGLPPEIKQEVWQKAVETAPQGTITAGHVETVRNIYHPRQPTPEIVVPSRTDRETARSELFRAMDLLPGSLEWSLLTQVWHWLRDAEPDNPTLQRELERIKAWYMPDVEPPDADIPEATIEGESHALVRRRQS
jgi:hypothetical protein